MGDDHHTGDPSAVDGLRLDADVIVVGCGPVGVVHALRDVQRGLSVIALDASTEVFPLPRAIGMDEEIQRLFQNAGLLDLVRRVSTPMYGAEFVDAAGTRLVGIDLPPGTLGPSGHPPMTMFDQPLLEQGLREAAVAAGVDMRLGVRATALSDEGGSVSLTVETPTGTCVLRSRWLVGADGASSTIRALAGIVFEDQGFDEEWLVIDTTVVDTELELPRIAQQVCDPERVITYVPGHGRRRRWEIQFNEGDTAENMLDHGRILSFLGRWARPDQLRIDRTAVYRFHALVADRFRVGNVFLAGDACHQMPPFNGQGMNTGLRDAENLSWKLAMVHDGLADIALLETYDLERRPHAKGQVEHSADAGKLINALAAGDAAETAAGYGGGRPFPHLEAGLRVGDHPALGKPVNQPTLGRQRLDDLLGPGFALVHTGRAAPASEATIAFWKRLGATTVEVPPDADLAIAMTAAPAHTVVVRPDRYVAAVTDDLDRTTVELARLMGTEL